MIRDAVLWTPLEEGEIRCSLCSHRCAIGPGKAGVCSVRKNMEGKLVTLVYGEVTAIHVDPIEKKPLHHFYPGSKALSIAAPGCNFRCAFCQNWQISQSPKQGNGIRGTSRLTPEEIVGEAVGNGCRSISYTYTEPTVFFEFALDTARLAKEAGLANNFVTNGYMTEEALDMIVPFLDAANVDVKSFNDETYRQVCGARLEPVLNSIRLMKKLGIWVEITTLVVPGLNDGKDELTAIAEFIAGIDPDIPWHISRFHPDYKYTGAPPTPVETLRSSFKIGKEAGLRYIYIGNVWGESEDTRCPGCGRLVIRRSGFHAESTGMDGSKCSSCGTTISGVFEI